MMGREELQMAEVVKPILCARGDRASHGYLGIHEITCLNSTSSLQLTVFLIRMIFGLHMGLHSEFEDAVFTFFAVEMYFQKL